MKDGKILSADPESSGNECSKADRQLTLIKHLVRQRNPENLEAVSHAFNIPVHVTESITALLQKLYDGQESSDRLAFEPVLEDLVQHGNHAFELSWCYFKLMVGSSNRVAFLNTLQHLISRINRPKHALRILLSDFCGCTDRVADSDRYAIMLANILLRTYNKELDVDIEMTPEEVLNVRNGLDQDVVHYAQFRIESAEDRFVEKVQSVHAQLIDDLKSASPDPKTPQHHSLIYLEREIYIFLSLLSGRVAHIVLTSALSEYGDPQARIYRYPVDRQVVSIFFQQLKILVRGVGRVGSVKDVKLLKQIAAHCDELAELDGTSENERSIVRISEWIENIIRSFSTSGLQAVAPQRVST